MAQQQTKSPSDAYATTQVTALETQPAPLAVRAPIASAASAIDSQTTALKLVVRGFSSMERSLLDGTVRLSQRRSPRLHLLADAEVGAADVVLVDARDIRAMEWARREPVLERKPVIWVDGTTAARGHTLARRPVQWSSLPMLLARALEQGPGTPPAAPSGSLDNAAPAAPGSLTRRPVLVVDDSLAVRAYLRSQLEVRGYRVIDVDNVKAALDAVCAANFGCVLMDVLMPGIDGYEGCKQIKAKLRNVASVPVIMLTSKSSPFDRIRGKMAGCDAYLTKPVDPKLLHETVEQQLQRHAHSGARTSKVAPSRDASVN